MKTLQEVRDALRTRPKQRVAVAAAAGGSCVNEVLLRYHVENEKRIYCIFLFHKERLHGYLYKIMNPKKVTH